MAMVSTHLMFEGAAGEAIELYRSTFPDFSVTAVEKYQAGESGQPGTIKQARATFGGHRLILIDSPISHDFGFTPSVSLFVEFEQGSELDRAFDALADGGSVLMPLDDYGFSVRFGWVTDRFGVSWQLNLPEA